MPVIEAAMGESICDALRAQASRIGISLGSEPEWAQAQQGEQRDPYTQEVYVVASWRGGARYGRAEIRPDGRVFAEYQVLCPHPVQADAFVESVQVWGRPGHWRGDAVIVAALGE